MEEEMNPDIDMKIGRRKEWDDSLVVIDNIPYEVLLYILCRLPTKSLLESKFVCKRWCSLIKDDPILAKMQFGHQSKKPTCLYIQFGMSFPLTYLYSIDDEDATVNLLRISPPQVLHAKYCRGLTCYEYPGRKLVVCNPCTGEQISLPDYSIGFGYVYGIGFDLSMNKYKVVRINESRGCHVFTLGSDKSWRQISNTPAKTVLLRNAFTANVNGVLHWGAKGMIISFDLKQEKFGVIPYPNSLIKHGFVIEVGGCLWLFGGDPSFRNLWILQDYNNHVWVSHFLVLPDIHIDGLVDIAIRNGDILTITRSSDRLHYYLCSYNQQSRVSKKVELLGLPQNIKFIMVANYEESVINPSNV